jgi:hypothetical protein
VTRQSWPSSPSLRTISDSGWDVPEPEPALVAGAAGYTVGDDVSSRSIEGAVVGSPRPRISEEAGR